MHLQVFVCRLSELIYANSFGEFLTHNKCSTEKVTYYLFVLAVFISFLFIFFCTSSFYFLLLKPISLFTLFYLYILFVKGLYFLFLPNNVVFLLFVLNQLYFLEQFYVYSKIVWKGQKFPIYSLPQLMHRLPHYPYPSPECCIC